MNDTPNQPPEPNPPKPAVLTYETPQYLAQTSDQAPFWRQGDCVMAMLGQKETPCYCFKCGEPTTMVTRLYAKARTSVTSVPYYLPLCERHGNQLLRCVQITRILGWTSLILLGLFISISAGSIQLRHLLPSAIRNIWEILPGTSFICFIAWAIMGRISLSVATVVEVDSHYVTLRGAGKEFLEKLKER